MIEKDISEDESPVPYHAPVPVVLTCEKCGILGLVNRDNYETLASNHTDHYGHDVYYYELKTSQPRRFAPDEEDA